MDKIILMVIEELKSKLPKRKAAFEIMYSLRKISQYDVVRWKDINESDADNVLSFAKKFLKFVEGEVS